MNTRINHQEVSPEIYNTMLKLEGFIASSGLDHTLYEFIKIRASQINGCAFCLDMHTTKLRSMGETNQRIDLISVWREVPFYSARERAALELTEAVTLISKAGVPDDVYSNAREYFSENEFLTIIMAINTINSWNRIAISTRMVPAQAQVQV
ncbi:AhpD family alkylhydroperoxidase [Paenibacillus cellulosilyticus]|uniref:AhpD family alkylhydroperoxidase n=1 Tax=Paenibacillus cellulosilyticus TaxID=375489 RepID=A0A2V2YVF8_9BACL|nr:carboxymuconolactone decarboxylase family protein [Paenibacillus cellulosilyticus]PWW05207.1 AhpD family alkylhydroperoxidase [Paenibacillus cellulosilyticus]QKS43531.1 carboxymuconolactone decarboxylase family protein [Paenibacillus cellulosilyticus]